MQRIRQSLRFTCSNYGTSNTIVSCLFIVLSLQMSSCQNTCSSGPCYPTPADISGRFNVTANSTCGDPEEQFCVDLNCDSVCNANNPDLIHPASFVNDIEDGVVTFWKAKNFEFPVELELDIGRTFMLYRSVVTFFHELPAAMYFLKSNDSGRTYRPISYFATNCMQYFNLPETPENDRDGLKVQCFKIDPGTNPSKQIYYSPMQDVNTAQNILTDSAKQALFLMTNLKIVLVKFVTPIGFDPATVPDSIKQSFFFAISDWDVLASCECNGQAAECDVTDPSKCICERNTTGHHCERCLPLFNNKPYQLREACESCSCNNHSQSCSYNESKGYGVCDDCQHNTMGDKCEWCKPTHYRNADVPFSSVDACLACNCSLVGSDNAQQCDQNGGQCSCKPHVIGRTCSTCRPDYFSFTSGQGCQACDCNMIGANQTSCDPATGQCFCRENVTGLHCDRCERYYYNFNSGMGCSPCSCHPTYSSDLQCDGSSGVCSCKPGINGGKCTGCADQFYNLTDAGCTSCLCNPAGSDNLICSKTTGQCPCKAQSLGRVCDECPVGHYGLNLQNPDGCLKCQCSNKSSTCVSDAGWLVTQITTTLNPLVNNIEMDGWSASDGAGGSVASEWSWLQLISITRASIQVDTSSAQEIYFDAPAKYLGDQRFAYTFSLSFQLQQDNAWSPAASSRGDIILRGRWFSQPLVTTLNSPPPGGDTFRKYEIKLSESYWRVGNTSGRQPTSYEMVVVLSDLTSLRIRAKWTSLNTQLYSCIGDISLKFSNRTSVLSNVEDASNVERCSCPSEYEGQFCARCKAGYTRVTPRGGPYVTCVPCMCNNHSNTCDPETGVCQNCQHDTAGDHCERCTDGWYGNATNGTSQDCSPCPCPSRPGASNQFASTCILDSDGQPTCVNCTTGHVGRRCETCMDGYYGRPEQSGQCRLCDCSNNIDTGSSGNCNTTSGECLKCLYNTTGFNCEWCAPELYGNALNKTCTGCSCSNVGATSNVCNNVTGNCDCQPHVTGMLCDECEQYAFNFTSSGCMECDCDVDGSSDLQCDSMYGNCSCRSNVIGSKCDMCSAGFFAVTQRCLDCGCNTTGTVNASNVCDKVTGQCPCKLLLTGRTCNQCQDGYFGLTSRDPGCSACNCNPAGSVKNSCSSTGQCFCRPRFFGDKCGCGCNNHSQSCTYSEAKGYGVCDDCQHNTMGDKCEVCKRPQYRNPHVPFSSVDACLGKHVVLCPEKLSEYCQKLRQNLKMFSEHM